jgi:hypothetical protein
MVAEQFDFQFGPVSKNLYKSWILKRLTAKKVI